MFPGNGKIKTLPVQKVYLIHFTTPGTHEEDCAENLLACQGLQYSTFQNKIEAVDIPKNDRYRHVEFSCSVGIAVQ